MGGKPTFAMGASIAENLLASGHSLGSRTEDFDVSSYLLVCCVLDPKRVLHSPRNDKWKKAEIYESC